GDPCSSLLLLGLGIDALSMTPRSLPEVKQLIRKTSFETLQQVGQAVLDMDGGKEVLAYLHEVLGELLTDAMIAEVSV
ncbi:MAG: phosphoenolpyruvate--protein phosphotransferase, partial [Candidatus Latescibacterota bacterium]